MNVIAPELVPQGLNAVENTGQLAWSIAPNPNSGVFNLNLDRAANETTRILISDLTGRIVHRQSVDPGLSSVSIHTERLPQGMYLVTLDSGTLKATRRMIVNH